MQIYSVRGGLFYNGVVGLVVLLLFLLKGRSLLVYLRILLRGIVDVTRVFLSYVIRSRIVVYIVASSELKVRGESVL